MICLFCENGKPWKTFYSIYRENPICVNVRITINKEENKMANTMENQTQENLKICQSCGMPMQEEQYGTEKDGSRNDKYCCYCYKEGEFAQNCTVEEMAEFCAPFEVEGGRAKTKEEAKAMLMAYFPTLERWKAQADM